MNKNHALNNNSSKNYYEYRKLAKGTEKEDYFSTSLPFAFEF